MQDNKVETTITIPKCLAIAIEPNHQRLYVSLEKAVNVYAADRNYDLVLTIPLNDAAMYKSPNILEILDTQLYVSEYGSWWIKSITPLILLRNPPRNFYV